MTTADREGRTALHYAAGPEGDPAEVRRLIAEGAEVALADRAGWTPLHFAAASNQVHAVEMLLNAGAPVDAIDEHGNTPLFRAVYAYVGNGRTIALLRAAGADAHLTNKHGHSAVGLARLIDTFDAESLFSDFNA